jgi:hypothetical protein
MRCGLTPVLVFGLMAGAAVGEPSVTCGLNDRDRFEDIALIFAGDWQIKHHAGFVVAGAMTLPFPASNDVETMAIEFTADGQMLGTHPEAQQPLVFEWADEPTWVFEDEARDDGVPGPLLSSNDLEILMDCTIDQMPRLIGRTTAVIDGTSMDMTVRLMVTTPEVMYGIFHATAVARGTLVNSWRSVTLIR